MTLVLELLLGSALALGFGLAVGALSATVYIVTLAPLAVGLGAAAGVSVAGLVGRGRPAHTSLAATVVAVLLGMAAFAWMDDGHFRDHHAQDWVAARAVSDGVEDLALLSDEDAALLSKEAAPALEMQALEQTGHGGFVGRWLMRADLGVRLLGPWSDSRGVAVGRIGAIVWTFIELLLAILIARAVLRRVGRLVAGVDRALNVP